MPGGPYYFEGPFRDRDPGDTHTLTMFNAEVTITVEYRPTRIDGSSFVLAARITMEGSSSSVGSEAYQDGPYAAMFSDSLEDESSLEWIGKKRVRGWKWTLGEQRFTLCTPSGAALTLCLGADLMWPSEYSLRLDVLREEGCSQPLSRPRGKQVELSALQRALKLTLPGHVKHALRLQGYDVQWTVPVGGWDATNVYRLTLSRNDIIISIQYAYALHPYRRYDPERGGDKVTFRANVECASARQYGASKEAKEVVHTLIWKDERPWKLELAAKHITLPLATGGDVVLSLSFYFVWYSEYCLMVKTSDAAPLWLRAAGTYRRLAEQSKAQLKLGKKREQTEGNGRTIR